MMVLAQPSAWHRVGARSPLPAPPSPTMAAQEAAAVWCTHFTSEAVPRVPESHRKEKPRFKFGAITNHSFEAYERQEQESDISPSRSSVLV